MSMSVRELIDELLKENPEDPVWADGCDCCNPVTHVERENGQVTLAVEL